MAEGGGDGGPPVLSYTYRCKDCKHEWQGLSHQEIGLVCSECKSTRIISPDKRGTYKYECEKCHSKWKKKNSTGGVSFCPDCKIPTYPYKFRPDVRIHHSSSYLIYFYLFQLTKVCVCVFVPAATKEKVWGVYLLCV